LFPELSPGKKDLLDAFLKNRTRPLYWEGPNYLLEIIQRTEDRGQKSEDR